MDALSERTKSTIDAALAPSTRAQYESAIKKFFAFVDSEQGDVSEPTFSLVLEFLQSLVDLNHSPSSVRAYAAAIQYHYRLHDIREHFQSTIYQRFLRGMARKAPLPKQRVAVWHVQNVLSKLEKLPVPDSFFDAAAEAALLILLATGMRVSDVSCLAANYDQVPEGWVIPFRDKRKAKVQGRYTSHCVLLLFPDCPRICPILALKRYLALAQVVRKPVESGDMALFVSSKGDRAHAKTIARWVSQLFQRLECPYTAGSCRSASASTAILNGIELDQVLRTAGWSNECTFRRFYSRPVVKSAINFLRK